ncbi:PREDICTED: uncharacterized protein LOC106751193 isoform X2 [Dinoponera quadriceps]|uniref:Uncharacterized protein LOC106751193 isoform X2 n=1 Tax=Dinoponera quadriceps TaxID=609295 RepID=A0A6P3Y9A8_DINQU|nr:PREDICTED: uncharacterized protein LOC106751193 isoform X2 [Dinoponera quadriceps]
MKHHPWQLSNGSLTNSSVDVFRSKTSIVKGGLPLQSLQKTSTLCTMIEADNHCTFRDIQVSFVLDGYYTI